MAYYQQPTQPHKIENHGYSSWYQYCNCCPYGYHIDLDFVRYCDSIGHQNDRTDSVRRRKDRRRQRQSMNVLLGLEPFIINDIEKGSKAINEESSKSLRLSVEKSGQDGLDQAVSDFERTLQRSNKLSHNLPDVTAVHETNNRVPLSSPMSFTFGSSLTVLPSATDATATATTKEYDTISLEMCGLSPIALQNIREQMALSLERTKELEERVKLIPSLQSQLSTLKEEKRQLLLQMQSNTEVNIVNGNYINNSITVPYSRVRSHSLTHSTSVENINKRERPPPPPRRDFAVMCSVLTRNVGVGHQYPHTKSVSTNTIKEDPQDKFADKWLTEKIKFFANDNPSFLLPQKPVVITKGTQTLLPKDKKETSSQTLSQQKNSYDSCTQTLRISKSVNDVGVLATIPKCNAVTETIVQTNTLGISDDTIDDDLCLNCTSNKLKLEEDNSISNEKLSISLASLNVARSKSFNLGEDKLNHIPRRQTVGCQYEPYHSHKASQYESKTQSTASQNSLEISHKAVQHESLKFSKITDTKDLNLDKKHVACNTQNTKIVTTEAACNTVELLEKTCVKCTKKEKEDFKKDDTVTPSRIPRPQIPSTTPVENRKFRRQDTYTKIPASANEASGLSGLDLNPKHNNELVHSSLEKVKESYQLSKVSASHNGIYSTSRTEQESSLLPESDLCQTSTQTHRKKVNPSKEMQAAMKVLNDSLQKGQTKNLKDQLKNAINIIQQEWFKMSSLVNANPLDVEDYLDCFEEISSDLLHYIVNMVDVSGNTAMHYAVSHGNFDVVSILLDSKVCDINQLNKAGYTSVMLVSLAEICSPTHANVVRRLFHLGDVNIRAKEHGQTALMLAVSHGRLDMVQMLLEAGADINIRDEDGSTALMCASEHGHIDIVKHFLSQPDCDSTITDVDGSTALKIAMEAGHRHIGVLLYAHERNLHGAAHGSKLKRNKSASASPKSPSSPLPLRHSNRALTDSKPTK